MSEIVRANAVGAALMNYVTDRRGGDLSGNEVRQLYSLGDLLLDRQEPVALGLDRSPKGIAAALRGALVGRLETDAERWKLADGIEVLERMDPEEHPNLLDLPRRASALT